MQTRRLALIVGAVLGLALAGCGGRAVETQQIRTVDHALGPTEIVVDVSRPFGGFTPVELQVDERPQFRLYGDGTVLVAVEETGTLPGLSSYTISEESIQAVLRRGEAAGLLSAPPDYGDPPITDLGVTSVHVLADGGTFEHAAYALGFEGEVGDALTTAQQAARERLIDFIDFVSRLPATSPEHLRSSPAPYVAETIEAHAWEAPTNSGQTVLDWPFRSPLRPDPACVALGPAEIAELTDLLAGVEEGILWRSDDALWSVGFNVLLPGDEGCAPDSALPGYVLPPESFAAELVPAGTLVATTEEEASAAEAALPGLLGAAEDERAGEVLERLGDYTRQYVGLEREGSRLVYVNAFCDDAGLDPQTQVVAVEDGGTCFWQALVDPAAGQLVDLSINGEA